MHSFLKIQIRKHLDLGNNINEADVSEFIAAVNSSYENYEEQLRMTQRTYAVSSQELYEANLKLNDESLSQKKIISSLNSAIRLLGKNIQGKKKELNLEELDALNLANLVENMAEKILKINMERENEFSNMERNNVSLNGYVHMVSHDLKKPLRNVNAILNWLKEEEIKGMSSAGKENVDDIFKNLEKMDYLIEGILNYSTVDHQTRERKTIKLDKLVKEIIRVNVIPKTIKVILEDTLPDVDGNTFMFQQLFQHIIANGIDAIGEKKDGEIKISVSDEGKMWEFAISDNGIGIAEMHLPTIFDIFQKVDNESTSSGIGLSIVKRVVNTLGGTVWATSKVGEGSIFYFTLKKKDS